MKSTSEITITRRAHLHALLAAAAASTIPSSVLAQSAEDTAVISALSNLDESQGRTLLAVSRTLFPHDALPDRFYWPIVSSIDTDMSSSDTASTVANGLQALGENFSALDEASREQALGKLEGGPFFSLLYTATINGLYLNEELWALFGYEGSSLEHGGYLHRGFDEVDWLPQETGSER